MLTAVSKKAAHFTVFVKCFFENSYKKLGPAFLQDPAFLNLVTLGDEPDPCLSVLKQFRKAVFLMAPQDPAHTEDTRSKNGAMQARRQAHRLWREWGTAGRQGASKASAFRTALRGSRRRKYHTEACCNLFRCFRTDAEAPAQTRCSTGAVRGTPQKSPAAEICSGWRTQSKAAGRSCSQGQPWQPPEEVPVLPCLDRV